VASQRALSTNGAELSGVHELSEGEECGPYQRAGENQVLSSMLNSQDTGLHLHHPILELFVFFFVFAIVKPFRR
jgi:hypothetical protein